MAWVLQENKNEGYPTNTNFPSSYTVDWSGTYPWGWIIQPQYNDGYPFRHPWFPTSSGGSGDGGGGDIGGDTPWEENPYTEIQEGYWTGLGGSTYISSMQDFSKAFEDIKTALMNKVDDAKTKANNAFQTFLDEPNLVNAQLCEAAQAAFKGVQNINESYFSNGYNTNYTECLLSCIRYPFDIS